MIFLHLEKLYKTQACKNIDYGGNFAYDKKEK